MKKTKKLHYAKETITRLTKLDLERVGGAASLNCTHSIGFTECVCSYENCSSIVDTARCEPSYQICG